MKFSEIDRGRWPELKPYIDTCLLPVTGLTGKEEPWAATEALERLRDALEEVEKRYFGRVVTYPAYHYTAGDHLKERLSEVCFHLREAGFAYVVLLTADPLIGGLERPEGADLLLNGQHVREGQAIRLIGELWHPKESVRVNES